jgi:hypothetical protein
MGKTRDSPVLSARVDEINLVSGKRTVGLVSERVVRAGGVVADGGDRLEAGRHEVSLLRTQLLKVFGDGALGEFGRRVFHLILQPQQHLAVRHCIFELNKTQLRSLFGFSILTWAFFMPASSVSFLIAFIMHTGDGFDKRFF